MRADAIMFSLIRKILSGETVGEDVKQALSDEMLEAVYNIANNQDLAHIAGQALSQLGLLTESEISKKFKEVTMAAAYRYMQMDHAYVLLCNALEGARIPFIPLKGSVIRDLYPEPCMRISGDIDVLVHEKDLEQAVSVLTTEHGFQYVRLDNHDVALRAPNQMYIEIHYTLLEEIRFSQSQQVLNKVWEYAAPVEEGRYQMALADEMFYFYHILHMAKHFEDGGCGVRPFLDLWLLNHCKEYNKTAREELLTQGKLLTFAQSVEKLSEVWLSAAEREALTDHLERFILDGGVYGNLQNKVAVQQTKRGSKFKYVLSKLFIPYEVIKFHYPILIKHRCLTPLYEVRRWMKLIFTSNVKRSVHTLKTNAEVSAEEISSTADLLKALGL